jgi:hypothetical protein
MRQPARSLPAGRYLPLRNRYLTSISIDRPGNAPAHPAVPADAVTASGSGLDPHISPAYANLQAARAAGADSSPERDWLGEGWTGHSGSIRTGWLRGPRSFLRDPRPCQCGSATTGAW